MTYDKELAQEMRQAYEETLPDAAVQDRVNLIVAAAGDGEEALRLCITSILDLTFANGIDVERKRCAEVARSVADEMGGRATRATWVGKAIAAAIERGDK